MALQSALFPIDQPVMPEERQIGRRSSIEGLERRLVGALHQWLIGERRIGKTSVAKAVLERLRERGSIALDIDLSKLGIVSHDSLAEEIARQAEVTGEGGALPGSEGRPALERVLTALALHARKSGQRCFVLLDEVQLIAKIPDADRHIARWCREPDSPIVFLFTGSEEAAVEALRGSGRPLTAIGQEFHLPAIGREDWVAGLRTRFAEAELPIGDEELETIVTASNGHPRRTMLIAAHVKNLWEAQPQAAAIGVVVEIAIEDAQKDRGWN